MHIDTSIVVVLSICELAAFIAIVYLWTRKRRMRVSTRLLWSVVLLVPFFGLLWFGFTRPDPEPHSDVVPPTTGDG